MYNTLLYHGCTVFLHHFRTFKQVRIVPTAGIVLLIRPALDALPPPPPSCRASAAARPPGGSHKLDYSSNGRSSINGASRVYHVTVKDTDAPGQQQQ